MERASKASVAKWSAAERVSVVSELVNRASERSEHSEVECCRVSKQSEQCERTNVASDRVALSKRDCHE